MALACSGPAAAQVLLEDNFDDGPVACGTLAPNWTTSDPNLGAIGTFTASSNSCSVFTRGAAVSITSQVIDASGVGGVDLTAVVQKGADAFSEDPDATTENLVLEYSDASGLFLPLQTFDAVAIPDGAVTAVNITLPFDALHANLQIRFRQLGGSGGPPANGGLGFDFWHIDDVVLVDNGTTTPPPPPPTLTADSCDDFEGGFVNWTTTDTVRSGISNVTSSSPSNSLFLRHGAVTTTSVVVPSPELDQITLVVQRGDDAFSENPEAGEDLVFEFLDNTGTFVVLETFPGDGTPGEVFTRSFTVPPSARHDTFRLRFRQLAGSGVDFDYWHVDDVCLINGVPELSVVKTVDIEPDPNGDTFAIPGAFARYTVQVTNSGVGSVDAGSVVLSTIVDANTTLFVGDLDASGGPIVFTDGSGSAASSLTLPFNGLLDPSDGVVFLDSSGTEIAPTADFDPNVASLDLKFDGAMLGAASGVPTSFTIEYRVQLN